MSRGALARVAFGYATTHSSALPRKRTSMRQRNGPRTSSLHFSMVLQTFLRAAHRPIKGNSSGAGQKSYNRYNLRMKPWALLEDDALKVQGAPFLHFASELGN